MCIFYGRENDPRAIELYHRRSAQIALGCINQRGNRRSPRARQLSRSVKLVVSCVDRPEKNA